MPAIQPLEPNRQLDRAAALWSGGGSPLQAAQQSGYRPRQVAGLRVSGTDDAILQALRRTRCRALEGRSLRDVGVFRRGRDTWLLIGSPDFDSLRTSVRTPALTPAPRTIAPRRVLQLVNAVRASGARCGDKSFGAAAPLQESALLDKVAYGHATDMARHDYFEHVDLSGHDPADRLHATGYREKLIGENIAYGPSSAEEVVAGWMHSPGHCANIMDSRFVEMGLALAPGQGARRGLYWDQELTQPAQ